MAEHAQYVTLGVAGELFAAPVEMVQEILDMRPVARLPQAPPNLLGMTDVRGEGIPVLDLRLTLGLPPAEDTENTRIVVLRAAWRCAKAEPAAILARMEAIKTEREAAQPLRVATGGRRLTVGLRTDRVFEVTVLDADALDPPPAISGDWQGQAVAGIGRRNGAFVTVLDLDRLLANGALPPAGIAA